MSCDLSLFCQSVINSQLNSNKMTPFKKEFTYKDLDVEIGQKQYEDYHCPDDYHFYIRTSDGYDIHDDGDFLNPDAAIEEAKKWIDDTKKDCRGTWHTKQKGGFYL